MIKAVSHTDRYRHAPENQTRPAFHRQRRGDDDELSAESQSLIFNVTPGLFAWHFCSNHSVQGGDSQERWVWEHAEKVILQNQSQKVTNTWHAPRPTPAGRRCRLGFWSRTAPGLGRIKPQQKTLNKRKKPEIIQALGGVLVKPG